MLTEEQVKRLEGVALRWNKHTAVDTECMLKLLGIPFLHIVGRSIESRALEYPYLTWQGGELAGTLFRPAHLRILKDLTELLIWWHTQE